MFENDCESDEDCEVYFLKPVNEYNIVDKIKEANKELFSTVDEDAINGNGNGNGQTALNRKVTFAPNLEDYEPAIATATAADGSPSPDPDPDDETQSLPKDNDHNDKKVNGESLKTQSQDHKIPTIAEEPEQDDNRPSDVDVTDDMNHNVKAMISAPIVHLTKADEGASGIVDDDVEEICEEIIIMDMESDGASPIGTGENSMAAPKSHGHGYSYMLRSPTFDYGSGGDGDNKSLTNLITSDYEDGDDDDDDRDNAGNAAGHRLAHSTGSLLDYTDDGHFFDAVDDDDDDGRNDYIDDNCNDDDDKLSIIVASYLPDDYDGKFRQRSATDSKLSSSKSEPPRQKRKISFGKRFTSLTRRKANSSNSVATMKPTSGSGGSNRSGGNGNDIDDMKFNYRICCEYRNAMSSAAASSCGGGGIVKLPKYTGYMSEYGLSREQLEARSEQRQRRQRSALQQAMKSSEQEMLKMQDNERAFTKWLKNKMRYPINKTRNMFDVKLRRGGGRTTAATATAAATSSSSGRPTSSAAMAAPPLTSTSASANGKMKRSANRNKIIK